MKLFNVIVGLTMTGTTAFAAGGGTVGSDKVKILNEAKVVDCRAGDQFFETNKGFKIDLTASTVQNYKNNGYANVGSAEPVECVRQEKYLSCTAAKFQLMIDDLTQITNQNSSDASDMLGAIFGGGTKHVYVVKGTIIKSGLLFDTNKNVVCALKNF